MDSRGRRGWLFPLVVLAAGAALRLWTIHAHPQIQGDSLIYGDIATNWLTHGIYGHSVGHASGPTTIEPTLVRLPGYPAFLALCFAVFGVANYHAVLYLQAISIWARACSSAVWQGRSAGPVPAGGRCCWRHSAPSLRTTPPLR